MEIKFEGTSYIGRYLGLIVFILAFGALISVESILSTHAISGVYFHGIPSESMMQTTSIMDLKNEPLTSLWNIHIQPPFFDAIRAILASSSMTSDPLLLQYWVDQGIYLIWAIVYGLTCALIFSWLLSLTNAPYAFFGTLLFALSPATLLYATLLETTFLSSFLILCFLFLLWRIKNNQHLSPWLLAISFLALFFTRSLFQWQLLFIIGFCLYLMNYPAKNIKKFLIICLLVISCYLLKQFSQFGIATTSSFTGLNLCQSIQACKPHFVPVKPQWSDVGLPVVLSREKKLTGAHNFNNLIDLELNKRYLSDYRERLSSLSITQLSSIYLDNLLIYFQPSSNYASTNILLSSLPVRWRAYYEKIFSTPILPIIIFICALFWFFSGGLKPKDNRKIVGFLIPIAAIFAISIFFESGENMRFKFFLEPVIYIFILSQLYLMGVLLLGNIRERWKSLQ